MKKILQVPGSLKLGGLETVAANYIKYLDNSKYKFVYLVYGNEQGELESEVENLGAEIVRIPLPSKNPLAFYKNLRFVIRDYGPFDIIHSHPSFNSGIVVKAAYDENIPIRIVQGHSSEKNKEINRIKVFYNRIMRKWLRKYSTEYLAVSEDAGYHLYGKSFFKEHGKIIKNGIDVNKYRFNPSIRKKIRKEINLENKIILGHTGTLIKVKNQKFLIELLPELLKTNPKYHLLLVGMGPDYSDLKELVNKMKLTNNVTFFGKTRDVPSILQAIDIFLFPSLYEGLPLSLLEAQSSSLPSVISDNISEEAVTNKNVQVLSLDDPEKWIDSIININVSERENITVEVENYGFGINKLARFLDDLYS